MDNFSEVLGRVTLDENLHFQGLDDLDVEETEGGLNEDDYKLLDSKKEFGDIDFLSLNECAFKNFQFSNLDLAFSFYNEYAKMRGFGARRGHVVRNKKSEIIQQTFLCYREGAREEKFINMENRKREARPETRCGCEAKVKVHVVNGTSRWQFTYFSDDHNHELLSDKYIGMLATHRKMSKTDIMEMNNLRDVGISTSHIFGSFASQAGGPSYMDFGLREMYNQIDRQRRMASTDANTALSYLRSLRRSDSNLFWSHTMDNERRLQHLFWSDGVSQADFEIFGDVLAFDATYRKNKYMCPVVVFSGVNHHNETCIFGAALVANETEETYVWVLEQFVAAMKGKRPVSVITDGDLAMRNAIRKVFPNAWHRLCAWHLLRNVTSNVAIPSFTKQLKQLIYGEFEVSQFRKKWDELISEFDLEGNSWVQDLYGRRKMWSEAYIRGRFFAGFRTTSRCEGFHSHLSKFVHSRHNLTEFLQHFSQCVSMVRFNEQHSDFVSNHGEPVMKSDLRALERSASAVYTRELFKVFRPMLGKAAKVNVVSLKQIGTCYIFTVKKFCTKGREWHISVCYSMEDFKCSCRKMESKGIPCEHIVAVLVYLDIDKLPKSLVLDRWTKLAKERVTINSSNPMSVSQTLFMSRYAGAVHICREMCRLSCLTDDGFYELKEKVTSEIQWLRAKHSESTISENGNNEAEENLRNPARVRSKGCGTSSAAQAGKAKRVIRCGVCKEIGHNRKSCSQAEPRSTNEQFGQEQGQ